METNQMVVSNNQTQPSIYSSVQSFEAAQRMAQQLATSTMVPKQYQNNISNTLVALEMAYRTGVSPLMVMQNLDVIQGKPSWSSSFIIACLNSCGRFTPLQFRVTPLGGKTVKFVTTEWIGGQKQRKESQIMIQDMSCVAYAHDRHGKLIEGPAVTVEMAVKEGWYTKADSKWQTMTELMLNYRSAAFFGRLYAPDVLQGMHSADEVKDFGGDIKEGSSPVAVQILNEKVNPQNVQVNNAQVMNEAID
jgi:hypothetical protein